MRALFLCIAIALSMKAYAQTSEGAVGLVQRVEDMAFHDCSQVEVIAHKSRERINNYAFNLALLPNSSRSVLINTFGSELSSIMPMRWLSSYHPAQSPFASLYVINGAYTFRCRDDQGHVTQSSGAAGDPLRLTSIGGNTAIWHFSKFGKNMARVMVVTDQALDTLDGEAILNEITGRLSARVVFLYIRNDPWFLDRASDSLPFIFTDQVKRLTENEYRSTRTMVCESGKRCEIVPSR